jgi:hypothetical protein
MCKRMLEIKSDLNAVLGESGIDTLLNSEWNKLEELMNLLEPFAIETNRLQTDSLSLSIIVPSLLNLECHLEQFATAKEITTLMLTDFKSRFSTILNSNSYQFNPLPAAACLLDHTVAPVILTSDMQHLAASAKLFIISQVVLYLATLH